MGQSGCLIIHYFKPVNFANLHLCYIVFVVRNGNYFFCIVIVSHSSLLCICRTPRNNRFIICCDECSKWFHGKCVGVSKPFGREIEERQNNWICPQCAKRRQSSINVSIHFVSFFRMFSVKIRFCF